jgi:hypothetical protein
MVNETYQKGKTRQIFQVERHNKEDSRNMYIGNKMVLSAICIKYAMHEWVFQRASKFSTSAKDELLESYIPI